MKRNMGVVTMKNKHRYKREFIPSELTEKAFAIYSDSDITFYEKEGIFWYGFNPQEHPAELGTIEDVEEFLLSFDE